MSPFVAELFGTMLLIIFGGGVVAGVLLKDSKSENGGWIVVTLAWGFAVAFGVYIAGQASGAHLNPAVTIALASAGKFAWADVPAYLAGQLLGAMLGATVVWLHYLPHWAKTPDAAAKLGVFATIPAIRRPFSNLLSEIIGTAVLLVGLSAIGANRFADGLNPLIVGFLVVAVGLSLGGPTGYAINPVRDFGPRLAHFLLPIAGKGPSDWSYAWIPVVGPLVGGVLGVHLFQAFDTGQIGIWLGLSAGLTLAIAILAVVKDRNG
ncbi:MAG: aquaporin family protein [Cytophagales bacterium]|nr:aquaporin family protein [Cytophagales bacterium]